jgi:hypothetical protein
MQKIYHQKLKKIDIKNAYNNKILIQKYNAKKEFYYYQIIEFC